MDDTLFSQALEAFKRGEIERSEDLCVGILQHNPRHSNALNLLGIIFLKLQDLEKAYDFIQLAITNNLQKAPAFSCNLALVLFAMGKIVQAAQTYKQAASLFLGQGEREEALDCLLKAAFLLRDCGDFAGAKGYYQDVLAIDSSHALAQNDLGIILQREGDFEGALAYFQQIVALDPTNVTAYNNLGLIFSLQKKQQEAIAALEKALELDPTCLEAYINFSNLYLAQEELDQALYYAKKALEIKQDHPGLHNNLGIIYHRLENLEQAEKHYTKALELDPDYEEAKKHLALLTEK